MTEEPENPHPDDAEFERLLGRVRKELRVPDGETYAQRAGREQRLRDLFDEVWQNAYPDWSPDAAPPEPLSAPDWIVFDPPLVPTPPAWRTSLVSVHGAEAERADRAEADAIIARAIEDAHADLDANKRAEGPRRAALQVLDHHLVRGEPLSARALELIGRALHLSPRAILAARRRARITAADEAEVGTKAIAAELGISERAVRLLRQPVEESDALVHFMALHGQPPRRSTRDEIARLLGRHGKHGRWPDRMREAARAEAERRAQGLAANNADAVAKDIKADPRKVERWMARPGWEMAVVVEAVWLRGGLRPKRNHRAGR